MTDSNQYYREILPFYELEAVSRAHLGFWRSTAKALRPRRILEIGSGLGRITAALAAIAPTVGLDLSMEMLARAPRRPGESLVRADLRGRVLRSAFDLVVAPGDPLSHLTRLEDRRKALRAVARELTPDGVFVLEGLYRRRNEVAYPRRRVRHPRGVLEIEEAWFPIGVGDLWHARYRYLDRRGDGSTRRQSAAFVARSWNRRTLREEFAACGLAVDGLWGDFDRSPFRPGSKRLVVTARRSR